MSWVSASYIPTMLKKPSLSFSLTPYSWTSLPLLATDIHTTVEASYGGWTNAVMTQPVCLPPEVCSSCLWTPVVGGG